MPIRSLQFALVVSRFNWEITDQLLRGAVAALRAHSVPLKKIRVVRVPGAFELPVAALRMARTKRYAAVVAVGCIMEGQTPQYAALSQGAHQGLMLAGVLTGVPVTCAVITARRWEHAVKRASTKGLNRGGEAAEAAWEMAHAR